MGQVASVIFGYNTSSTHVRLPFASATYGRRPARTKDWTLSNAGHPLAFGRSVKELARGLYRA